MEQGPKWEPNISATMGRRNPGLHRSYLLPALASPPALLQPHWCWCQARGCEAPGPPCAAARCRSVTAGREPAPPVSVRHGPAVARCALRQGAAAAGASSGAGSCSISSGERAACCSHGRKAPFWAASSPLGWKAPPELVLQVSSFCFFRETDFFHVRGIQIGSKLLRILFVHRSIQAWPFTVLL